MVNRLVQAIQNSLPEGRPLPRDVWRRHHRAILLLLWLHAIGIACFALIAGYGVVHSLVDGGVLVVPALLGASERLNDRLRAMVASFGLVTASAMLVHLSGGYIELHFHFFVMIVVIALYQDWAPFLLAISYVLVEHAVVGVLFPMAVYNHPDAWAHPWKWAAIHALFVTGSCIASLVNWRLNEKARVELELILNSVGEGIYGLDLQGQCTFINSAATKYTGWTPEDLIGNDRILCKITADDPHGLGAVSSISAAMRDGVVHLGCDATFRRKDGRRFPVEYMCTPIRKRGQTVGLVVTFKDITERKRAETMLQKSEASLLAAQRIAHLGSWEWDLVTDEVVWSDEVYRIVGFVPGEIAPSYEQFMTTIHPDDLEYVQRSIQTALYEGQEYNIEFRLVQPDGSECVVHGQAEVIIDAGRPLRMVGTLHDITERKRVDRMKNEFVSVVSHELRTPLTAIRGSLGLLKGGVAGILSPQAKTMIEIAENNSARLVRLINDILDIEKIESGKIVFQFRPIELEPFLQQAIKANCAYAAQFDVHLVLHCTVPGVQVNADSDRLMQVLTNLLSNAAKFSPPNGTVMMTVSQHDQNIRIAVSDHGPGIPSEFRERIFQKFAQADSSDTRQNGGTGLGLSIAQAIVERHGGHIDFRSEPNVGTTFYFDLPEWHNSVVCETSV